MKIKKTHNISLRHFLIVVLTLVGVENSGIYAQTNVSLYVGQSQIVSAPKPPQGALYSVAWGSRHASVSVSNDGTYGGQIKVNSYFTGTAQVQCDYYWRWYVGTRMYTNHATIYYNVTCKAVTLRVSPESIILSPGQGTTISYSLSPTITPTPMVRFYSNNTDVATISSNGYVYAVGSGSAMITVENSAGPSTTCSIKVNDVPVTSATVSSPINAIADESKMLSVSVYPSNATVRAKSWNIAEGSDYISLTSSGTLTGKNPGTAKVYCMINGSITSNTAIVHISEPPFTKSNSSPTANAMGVSAFAMPSITYSLALYKGDNFSSIVLKNNNTGKEVKGIPSISNKTVTFSPTKPLNELTDYTLTIPTNAVKNKWGTHYKSIVNISFQTGEWEKLTLTASMKSSFVSVGDKVTLKANISNTKIYYTTDGSTPTTQSILYSQAIVLEKDTKLRAIAMCDGYKNSEILSENYLITNVNIAKKFPNEEPLYIYQDINPYIKFSNAIEVSNHIGEVKLTKNGGEIVNGEIIVADSAIFFIPQKPLLVGCSYQMTIPDDAIKTWQGESNHATSWSFSTGNYATSIAMGGPELAIAQKTDGCLLTWGVRYKSGNALDGSYTMNSLFTPSAFLSENVLSISSGYMHHAIIKNDGSLWMWGRQYCGEFGNNSTIGSANPIKVLDDVSSVSCGGQTTAIVKIDGSLWMCGRNDFGQIGDSSVVNRNSPVKIMEDVYAATASWCTTYAIKKDGSLWAWGRNDKYQYGNGRTEEHWLPIKIMENVAIVSASATESQWVAVVKRDGSLWTWGTIQPKPTKMLDNVSSVAVGTDYVEAVKNDGTLWAFGGNAFGQIGNGTTVASTTPIKVKDNVAMVASGGQTTIINMQNGSVWTWGRNNTGTLGDGTTPSLTAYSTKPIQVIEGRSSSLLTGITSRKKTYRIAKGSVNVIDVIPIPLNAVYNDLSWNSKNSSIVSVTERGVIKAEDFGETDVVVTIKNDKGAKYSITCHVIVADETEINNVRTDNNIKVWTNNHQLYIAGLQLGQHVNVYTSNGTIIYQDVANEVTMTIPVNSFRVYIVRIDGYFIKVLAQ